MTEIPDSVDVTERQAEYLAALPQDTQQAWGNATGVAKSTVNGVVKRLREIDGLAIEKTDGQWDVEFSTVESEDVADDSSPDETVQDDSSDGDEAPPVPSFDTGESDTIPSADSLPDGLLRTLRQDGLTYDDFRAEFGWSRDQTARLLQRLREAGYQLEFDTVDSQGTRLWYIPDDSNKRYRVGSGDGHYRFGLISDTHLGAQTERLDALNDFYDRLVDRGIELVFHAGDISDGWKVHRGHINAIKGEASGWHRLRNYVVDHYPTRRGIDTLFIEGNHDHKYYRRNGIHFGELIANQRDDLHYLGDSQARIVFDERNDIDLELIHPAGGKPYTLGYRLQTLYRERPLDSRPTLAAIGHLHGQMQAEAEGVMGFYTGCWKDLTTYGQRRGHKASVGGWIIDLEIEHGEVRSLGTQWVTYGADSTDADYTMHDISDMVEQTPQTLPGGD